MYQPIGRIDKCYLIIIKDEGSGGKRERKTIEKGHDHFKK